jgi:phosphate transport system substrate-binding protein
MFGFGMPELVIILVIMVAIFGPGKLPHLGAPFGILLLVCLMMLPEVARGELSYIGSSCIATGILNAGAAEAFEKKTGRKFSSVQIPGSGKGLDALMDGETGLAGVARPLKPQEMKQGLTATMIGHDAIAVFVHAENPVQDLSRQQLKGIFTGRITNWKDVGGQQASIEPTPEFLNWKRATLEIFQKIIMDGADYGDARRVSLPRDMLLQLARNPNGICTASTGLVASLPSDLRKNIKAVSVNGVRPTVRNVRAGSYPITRPLLLVTKGIPEGEEKEFINFILSPEGQEIVSSNFIPVRKKK